MIYKFKHSIQFHGFSVPFTQPDALDKPKKKKGKREWCGFMHKAKTKRIKTHRIPKPKSEISCQSGVINESNTKITKTHLNSKTQLQNNKKKKGISSVSWNEPNTKRIKTHFNSQTQLPSNPKNGKEKENRHRFPVHVVLWMNRRPKK